MIFAAEIPSAVTEEEASALSDAARNRLVLEMGSQYGRSTIALASTARRVHAVDWHRGDAQAGWDDSLPALIANLEAAGVREKVIVHVGRFDDVLPLLRLEQFEFAFLDGCHHRAEVERDLTLLSRFWARRRGKVAVFHDYVRFEDVRLPVRRLADETGADLEVVGSTAFLRW